MTYRSDTEKRLEKYLVGLFGFLVQVVVSFLNAWFVMLGLGVANKYWPQIPALGYWATVLVILGISALAGSIHGGMRVKVKDN